MPVKEIQVERPLNFFFNNTLPSPPQAVTMIMMPGKQCGSSRIILPWAVCQVGEVGGPQLGLCTT